MSETTVEIKVPAPLLQFGIDREDVQRRVTQWLVLSLFTEERISSGKAARLLNMSRIEFLTFLRTHGVAYIDYSADELAAEFAAVDELRIQTNE